MANSLFNFLPLILALTVGACNSTHSPAPVRSGNSYSSYSKGGIKTSTYTVQSGDTLYSIAWLTNSNVTDLAKINNLRQPYTLSHGQKLRIQKPQIISLPTQPKKSPQIAKTSPKVATKPVVKPPVKSKIASTQTKSTPIKSSSQIRWQWPTKGRITSLFSSSKIGSNGIDISGALSQPICAAEDGKVVYAGNGLQGYGNLVIIKHSNNFLSAYAHNQRLLVKEGLNVTSGQEIAKMGSVESRAKLRFEIRYNGIPVDPLKYLPKL